jgi:hypothetical protein
MSVWDLPLSGQQCIWFLTSLFWSLSPFLLQFEDASEELQRLRDRHDLRLFLALPSLRAAALAVLDAGGSLPDAGTLARARTELRLCRPQLRRVWEAALFALAQERPESEAAAAAVEAAVRARIEGQVASAKRGAQGKAVRDTDSGFIMCKTKKKQLIPAAPVEQASATQQAEAIDDAVAKRLEEIAATLGGAGADGDVDEEEEIDEEEE